LGHCEPQALERESSIPNAPALTQEESIVRAFFAFFWPFACKWLTDFQPRERFSLFRLLQPEIARAGAGAVSSRRYVYSRTRSGLDNALTAAHDANLVTLLAGDSGKWLAVQAPEKVHEFQVFVGEHLPVFISEYQTGWLEAAKPSHSSSPASSAGQHHAFQLGLVTCEKLTLFQQYQSSPYRTAADHLDSVPPTDQCALWTSFKVHLKPGFLHERIHEQAFKDGFTRRNSPWPTSQVLSGCLKSARRPPSSDYSASFGSEAMATYAHLHAVQKLQSSPSSNSQRRWTRRCLSCPPNCSYRRTSLPASNGSERQLGRPLQD
jgi:hypothetical protein